MATEAAENPSGRVSTVFRRPAERQGAYDFLESKHVAPDAILAAATDATARRAAQFPFVFVPLDGTSLTLTDLARAKDFGSVGARARGARGLKVIDAVAVAPDGTPLGIAAMKWWARGARPARNRYARSTAEKESHSSEPRARGGQPRPERADRLEKRVPRSVDRSQRAVVPPAEDRADNVGR
jgi:hypothetical protein